MAAKMYVFALDSGCHLGLACHPAGASSFLLASKTAPRKARGSGIFGDQLFPLARVTKRLRGRPVTRRLQARIQAWSGYVANEITAATIWPSGLRRWLKAPFRKGVGSNPTAVTRNAAARRKFRHSDPRWRDACADQTFRLAGPLPRSYFRHRDSNPGRSGQSRVSYPARLWRSRNAQLLLQSQIRRGASA